MDKEKKGRQRKEIKEYEEKKKEKEKERKKIYINIYPKKKEKEKEEKKEGITPALIKEEWNKIAEKKKHLPKKRILSEALSKKINTRTKEFPEWSTWRRMFRAILKSKVLGEEKNGWFSLDWVMHSSEHFEKVCSGWMEWKAEKREKSPAEKRNKHTYLLDPEMFKQGMSKVKVVD